jgi:hypothetical protein
MLVDSFAPRACNGKDIVVRELSGELLVYDRETDSVHCLNSTAALVWKHCDGHTPIAELSAILQKQTNLPDPSRMIWMALEQLDRAHLLTERIPRSGVAKGTVSRREMMRKLGTAAAIALPLVTSMIAPEPAQAASCVACAKSCANGKICCSPCTCQSFGNRLVCA